MHITFYIINSKKNIPCFFQHEDDSAPTNPGDTPVNPNFSLPNLQPFQAATLVVDWPLEDILDVWEAAVE